MSKGSFSKNQWNETVLDNDGSFLQSWEWGEFQRQLRCKVFRLGKEDGSFLAQVIKKPLFLGKHFFYLPRVKFRSEKCGVRSENLRKIVEMLGSVAEEESIVFFKVEPDVAASKVNPELPAFKSAGFIKSFKDVQPTATLLLDISESEEDLMSNFHSKTRYNIRYGPKRGVEAKVLKSRGAFDSFLALLKKTASRKDFVIYGKDYYEDLFKLGKDKKSDLKVDFLGAFYKNRLISAVVLVCFGKKAIYLHGANDYKYRNLMASYLLQWEAIKKAKSYGCSQYDLWGIIRQDNFASEKKFKNHPWHGVTRFKKKFGGKEVSYPGAYDYIYSPGWYQTYKQASRFKTLIGG